MKPNIMNRIKAPGFFDFVIGFNFGYACFDHLDAAKWSSISMSGRFAASNEWPLGLPKLVEHPVDMIPFHTKVGLGS